MAQNPELLKSARQWIQTLDVRGVGNTQEVFVYFVQNGLARDIAQIVSSVLGLGGTGGGMGQQIVPSGRSASRSAFGGGGGGLGGGGGSFGGGGLGGGGGSFGGGGLGGGGGSFGGGGLGGGGSSFGGGGGSFGGASTTGGTGGIAGSSFGSTSSRSTGTTTGGAAATGTGTAGAGGGVKPGGIFTGEVMIIPDEVNNAIVVRANAVDYAKIKKTIETLDILPRAVLVEVMIVEVDLNKDFSYGLQYYFQTHPSTNTGYSLSFGGLSNTGASSTISSSSTLTPPLPPPRAYFLLISGQ